MTKERNPHERAAISGNILTSVGEVATATRRHSHKIGFKIRFDRDERYSLLSLEEYDSLGAARLQHFRQHDGPLREAYGCLIRQAVVAAKLQDFES